MRNIKLENQVVGTSQDFHLEKLGSRQALACLSLAETKLLKCRRPDQMGPTKPYNPCLIKTSVLTFSGVKSTAGHGESVFAYDHIQDQPNVFSYVLTH